MIVSRERIGYQREKGRQRSPSEVLFQRNVGPLWPDVWTTLRRMVYTHREEHAPPTLPPYRPC